MGDEGSERLTQPSGHLTAGLLEPQRESETANPLIISFLTFHALLFLTPLLPFAPPEALKGSEALRFTLNFSASFPLEQPNPDPMQRYRNESVSSVCGTPPIHHRIPCHRYDTWYTTQNRWPCIHTIHSIPVTRNSDIPCESRWQRRLCRAGKACVVGVCVQPTLV